MQTLDSELKKPSCINLGIVSQQKEVTDRRHLKSQKATRNVMRLEFKQQEQAISPYVHSERLSDCERKPVTDLVAVTAKPIRDAHQMPSFDTQESVKKAFAQSQQKVFRTKPGKVESRVLQHFQSSAATQTLKSYIQHKAINNGVLDQSARSLGHEAQPGTSTNSVAAPHIGNQLQRPEPVREVTI